MGDPPPGKWLDRRDNEGNYERTIAAGRLQPKPVIVDLLSASVGAPISRKLRRTPLL